MKLSRFFLLACINISCRPSYESTIQTILPYEFNFKITSCEESNLLYFEGIDNNGKKVHEEIQYFWDIEKYYDIGDSIIKKKGEKEIILVKSDTTIILRFGGQDGPLDPKEQDSIFKILMGK